MLAATVLELPRYTIFSMEFGRKLLPPHLHLVTIIFDMTNFGPSNMDLGFVRVRCRSGGAAGRRRSLTSSAAALAPCSTATAW